MSCCIAARGALFLDNTRDQDGCVSLEGNRFIGNETARDPIQKTGRLITSWSPNGKSVELYKREEGKYYILVKTAEEECVVSQEDIKGLDLNRLKSPDAIALIQKASYVTLNRTSDRSYKVEIHAQGKGGVLPLIVGGCLIAGYIVGKFDEKREYSRRVEKMQKRLKKTGEEYDELITEMKKMEEALREDREKMQAVINSQKTRIDNLERERGEQDRIIEQLRRENDDLRMRRPDGGAAVLVEDRRWAGGPPRV